MIIIDGGIEREATDEEIRYIEEIQLRDSIMCKKMELSSIEQQLSESDYKIIKSYECTLMNMELPYDMESLHSERQKMRDRINSLREEIDDFEIKLEKNERKEENDSN